MEVVSICLRNCRMDFDTLLLRAYPESCMEYFIVLAI